MPTTAWKDNWSDQGLECLEVVDDYSERKLSNGFDDELPHQGTVPRGLQSSPHNFYDELPHQGTVPRGLQITDYANEFIGYSVLDSFSDTVAGTTSVASGNSMDSVDIDIDIMAMYTYRYSHSNEYQYQHTWLSRQKSRSPTAGFVPNQYKNEPGDVPPVNLQESLDSRFCKIGKPSRFFTVGRLFMTLWTEPTSSKYSNNDQITKAWLGTNAYSEIRRFIVIREGKGYSLCSPVHTYGGQGTLKPRLDAEEHAAIYVKGTEPIIRKEEKMTIEPFPVIIEDNENNNCKAQVLHPMSRVNFGKIYTVEHYSRVLKIGRIDQGHLERLRQCAGLNSLPKVNSQLSNGNGNGQIDNQAGTIKAEKAAQTGVGGNEYLKMQHSIKQNCVNLPDDGKSTFKQEQATNNLQRQPLFKSQLQGDAKPFASSQYPSANIRHCPQSSSTDSHEKGNGT